MESCLRCGKRVLRGTQSVAQRLRVEFGDQVIRLYLLAHIHLAGNHPAIDAEREAFLRAGADMAGNGYRFTFCMGGRRDGPDRSDFGRRGRLLVAGNQDSQAEAGNNGCA